MTTVKKGDLYVVATPIGNLQDITLRALEVLKSVEFIICEDTRTAGKLLNHYNIDKKKYSYYSPKEYIQAGKYISFIEKGKDAALISESGTPCISDPGYEIIRKAYEKDIKVIPLPGASALTSAVSACGMPAKEIFFAGFLPRKKGQRKKYLEKHLNRGYLVVFYESKYRIKDTLRFIKDIDPDRIVCIAREMTKIYEEFIKGDAASVENMIDKMNNPKGEFVVIC